MRDAHLHSGAVLLYAWGTGVGTAQAAFAQEKGTEPKPFFGMPAAGQQEGRQSPSSSIEEVLGRRLSEPQQQEGSSGLRSGGGGGGGGGGGIPKAASTSHLATLLPQRSGLAPLVSAPAGCSAPSVWSC